MLLQGSVGFGKVSSDASVGPCRDCARKPLNYEPLFIVFSPTHKEKLKHPNSDNLKP